MKSEPNLLPLSLTPEEQDLIEFKAENEAFDSLMDSLNATESNAPRDDIDILASRLAKWEAKAASLKEYYAPILESIQAQISHAETRAKRARELIQWRYTDTTNEHVTDYSRVYYKPSKRIEVLDESLIPAEYKKIYSKVSLQEIERAIKAGNTIPGAEAVTHYHLQVSITGGDKGRALSYARAQRLAKKESVD